MELNKQKERSGTTVVKNPSNPRKQDTFLGSGRMFVMMIMVVMGGGNN
jgi:hypothetical protein